MRFLCVLMGVFALGFTAEAADKPNIIVILCDDLGYGDLGCYGHEHIKTPHLDQMAKDGTRFTSFYSTAPVCSPSRVGLLTGRSPNRAGVYDWIPGGHRMHMRASEVTIAQVLKKAGYATCMSGKWHCNGAFNTTRQPQPDAAGFDHWFATQNNAAPSHRNPGNFVRNSEKVGPLKGFSAHLVVDEGINWLKGHREKNPDQPFFMYVAFHEPHEPVASPKAMVDGYMDVVEKREQAEYFANVENLDAAVGKLVAYLDEQKLSDDTLIIFTSDNGPETLNRYGRGSARSYGVPGPLRGMKLWTTEAGFRVCGIMKWPGKVKAGVVSDHVVSALDFLPTFADLAGAEVPKELALDGANFLPVLKDKAIEREKPLVWAYYGALNQRRVAMRDGDWKVLAKLQGVGKFKTLTKKNAEGVKKAALTDVQIFRVVDDIHESKDLSKSDPEALKTLTARLEKYYGELLEDSHVW